MKRNTVTLVALLAVLLVVAYLVMQRQGERSTSGEGALLVHVDSVTVNKFEIQSSKSRVVLERQGADWYLKEPINYKADQAAVGNLIHDLKNITIKSVVSSKPEKFEIFQVDTVAGTRVTVFENGSPTNSLIVGKVGGSYTEQYVRKLPSNDVNAIDVATSYLTSRPVNEWRDKSIVVTPKESIKELKYQYGDTTFTLAFKDSAWMIGKDTVRTGDISGILNSLADFKADDFIDSTMSPAPRLSALVSYAGVQLRFSFLKTQNKYAVQSSNSPQWFTVDTWKTTSILKRKKDFIPSRR